MQVASVALVVTVLPVPVVSEALALLGRCVRQRPRTAEVPLRGGTTPYISKTRHNASKVDRPLSNFEHT